MHPTMTAGDQYGRDAQRIFRASVGGAAALTCLSSMVSVEQGVCF